MELSEIDFSGWKQVDAPQIVRNALRREVVKAGGDPNSIRESLPDGWTKTKPIIVTVTGGGTPSARRAVTSENVEVRVHGEYQPQVRKLLTNIDGFLCRPAAVTWAAQVKPASRILVMPDSKLGGYVGMGVYLVTSHSWGE